MKKAKVIAAIALVHCIVFSLLMVFAISQGMRGFDSGAQSPTWVILLGKLAISQLMPAIWIIGHIGKPIAKFFPGVFGYVLFYLNSVVLVTVYWYLFVTLQRLRK
jgi:hypothetical protein